MYVYNITTPPPPPPPPPPHPPHPRCFHPRFFFSNFPIHLFAPPLTSNPGSAPGTQVRLCEQAPTEHIT